MGCTIHIVSVSLFKKDESFAFKKAIRGHFSGSSLPEQSEVIRRSKDCIRNAGS